MKKILSLVLVMLMCISCLSCFAESAVYGSTKAFVSYMDRNGIKYDILGLLDYGAEVVSVSFDCNNWNSLKVYCMFSDDGEVVSLRIYDIITSSAGRNYTCAVLNSINFDYKFIKMDFDESDSTVMAELDMYIDSATCGRPVMDAVFALIKILDKDDVYQALSVLQ